MARNAVQYAGKGGEASRSLLSVHENGRPSLVVTITDYGAGIPEDVALGRRGGGLMAARKLVDELSISAMRDVGAVVTLSRALPKAGAKLTPELIRSVIEAFSEDFAHNPFEELRRQNREIADAFALLRQREDELARTNRELADTNSGVLALYAELEEKADTLKRSAESKERFYSEMNHELRTPLNAILSLSEILLNGSLGVPTESQLKPLGFLRKSAQQMSENWWTMIARSSARRSWQDDLYA